MKKFWLSAGILMAALGLVACGGATEEAPLPETETPATQQYLRCVNGWCPEGYFCHFYPDGTCYPCRVNPSACVSFSE